MCEPSSDWPSFSACARVIVFSGDSFCSVFQIF
jgi:hypothetical protein